jgi:hypothetical protein
MGNRILYTVNAKDVFALHCQLERNGQWLLRPIYVLWKKKKPLSLNGLLTHLLHPRSTSKKISWYNIHIILCPSLRINYSSAEDS